MIYLVTPDSSHGKHYSNNFLSTPKGHQIQGMNFKHKLQFATFKKIQLIINDLLILLPKHAMTRGLCTLAGWPALMLAGWPAIQSYLIQQLNNLTNSVPLLWTWYECML